jgi:hypothetical protein
VEQMGWEVPMVLYTFAYLVVTSLQEITHSDKTV